MTPVIFAVLVGIGVYLLVLALIPKRILTDSTPYTRNALQKLLREKPKDDETDDTMSVLRAQTGSSSFMARAFFTLPGTKAAYPLLLKAGLNSKIGGFFTLCLVVFVVLLYALKEIGIWDILAAPALSYLFGWWVIKRRIKKRNDAFLNYFPDALDMIVRSVRSGYPLNAAVRMVADNLQPPVSTEFKQVADEIAYGSTLIEALQRLSLRIDEPDVKFFVVVLTVQQDVGGNLSEVLNNLSGIIRKRKYLRLKIKALASEGRATAWVLGSMPFAEGLIIFMVSPNHLTPLFTTSLGHTILGATIGVVALGIFITKQLVTIKV